jgi:hypothetical protein
MQRGEITMRWSALISFTALAAMVAGCGAADDQTMEQDGESAEATGQVESALAGPYYTFGIGSGISSSDLLKVMDNSESYFVGPYAVAGNSYLQATYSERFTKYPEALWSQNLEWLRSAGLFDGEQTEQHWFVNTAAPMICGRTATTWSVRMDYEVSSEPSWDWLWINSTGSKCGDAGVVHKRVSGSEAGSVSFKLPAGCSAAWIGVYYIKDGSLAGGQDMGRVKNVSITPDIPACICNPPPGQKGCG